MHCKQIARQTDGEITEIRLDQDLYCSEASICRRKGVCVFSPHSSSGLVDSQKEQAADGARQSPEEETYRSFFEVLQFKNSLGFQWMRLGSFADAVRFFESRRQKGQPKLIRRVEIFKLPD